MDKINQLTKEDFLNDARNDWVQKMVFAEIELAKMEKSLKIKKFKEEKEKELYLSAVDGSKIEIKEAKETIKVIDELLKKKK